jgi:predicted esterase YcpF (UPF0227 family)
MALVMEGIRDWPPESTAVMGSSLGGFYATYVAQHTGCSKVILLNPAIYPARDLQKYIGLQTSWHDAMEQFFFQPAYIVALRALECGVLTHPERYFVIINQGDEVLDWREMHARYTLSKLRVMEGGDHAISDFPTHLPEIFSFLLGQSPDVFIV